MFNAWQISCSAGSGWPATRVAASDVPGGVLARVAGANGEAVARAVRRLLGDVPALLGDDPFARKW